MSCFLLFGCAKDKTADEARQQKVERQIALYKSVSASYRGTLTNQDNGSSMGSIQIDFWPQNITVNSSDNTSTASQVILQGKVTIINSAQSEAVIQTASYFSSDYSTNGMFNGNISIPVPASGTSAAQTVQMVISGSIRGNSFNGQITTQSRAGVTGVFAAVKDAAINTTTTSSVGDHSIQTFAGVLDDLPKTTAKMTIRKVANTVEENFLNNFALQKSVSIQLIFVDDVGNKIDGVVFNGAQMDEQSGGMHAVTSYSGSVNALVSLDCLLFKTAVPPTWQCTYMSNFNGISHQFSAVEVKK